MEDHVHILFRLDATQTVSETLRILKGGSSFHINRSGTSKVKIQWSNKYFAGSVWYNDLGKVRRYIRKQQQHHAKSKFDQQYDQFICDYLDSVERERSGG